MGWGAAAAIAAIVGTGASIYQGQQNAKAQNQAMQQAQANAQAQAKAADEATNAANRKQANPNALLAAAQQAGKAGGSSTMLTGAQGIGADQLSLGRNTLLGGG